MEFLFFLVEFWEVSFHGAIVISVSVTYNEKQFETEATHMTELVFSVNRVAHCLIGSSHTACVSKVVSVAQQWKFLSEVMAVD